MKLVGEDMFFLLVKSIFFLPLYVGAYYTSTPDEKTYIEEGSSVPFLWTVNGSSTVTEVYFGTGDADELKSGYLRVQPGNKVIPQARYNGRVNFTGDLNTGTIRFQLSNVNRSDGNKYYGCDTYIKPQGGSLTLLRWKQPILLNVLVAPKFYSVPTVPSSLKEGDSLSIVCSTSDGNPTPVVSWMKGAVNVSSGWGRADLNFTSLKRENSDKYECVATNRLTTIKHTIQLDVLYAPFFKEESEEKKFYTSDENITLVCIADGKPTPNITWTKDGEAITSNIEKDGNKSTLALSLDPKNDDRYVCMASNRQGKAYKTITLVFKGDVRPATTTTDPKTAPQKGDDAVLIGAVVGGVLGVILVVVIIVYILKCRKGGRRHRSNQGMGGFKERGTKSVSDIDDYEPVSRNNELLQYASVDRSKKTPRKPELNYAELDHRGPERSVDRRPGSRTSEPTTYAEIVQTWEPTNERTYANVPRGGVNSSDML